MPEDAGDESRLQRCTLVCTIAWGAARLRRAANNAAPLALNTYLSSRTFCQNRGGV